ncbi:DUF1572 domain-containing protein [Paenibacillus sp. N3.4]|uniref:DUF1572 domain-containing protein n=1 Tax=Paenibacillus sp. N3.4 TaxID=2603222 RepID=UPI0021C2FF1E|nr:DUF1572 domain-containing protein [Paenibacillus sp. N3.4]
MSVNTDVGRIFVQESIRAFESMKQLADRTFAQVEEEQFYLTLDSESNSLEVLIMHMHGNMLSRWTDFLTSDGEKETRERDGEFENKQLSNEELLALWEEGWGVLLGTLRSLTPDDLLKTVYIRGEGNTVVNAIQRQVSHYGYHVGQIVFLGKHWAAITGKR